MNTLQELENSDWGDPNHGETTMIRKCLALRRKPISDFFDEDLRLMIGQQIGLNHLVPIALDVLEKNPHAGGDCFEGAMIEVLCRIDREWWAIHVTEATRFRAIIEGIDWNNELEWVDRSCVEFWIQAYPVQHAGTSNPD